jgi:hypothetical protein
MKGFCNEVLPGMLTKACGVPASGAARVASDIYLRSEAVAHLNEVDCEILAAPFFEESFTYKPVDAEPWMKAFTTLAVRNSQLEELHANDGPVKASGIEGITTVTLPPLSHLLAARRQHPLPDGSYSQIFAGLDAEYPRAWACLSALRQAFVNGGGRVGYKMPTAHPPELPAPEEITEAPSADHLQPPPGALKAVVFSGIDPRFDQTAISSLKSAQEGNGLLLGLSSLSRISRNSGKLLRALDFLLAYQAKIITTNTLLTSKDVWVRNKYPVKPNSEDTALSGLRDLQGISGSHRKTVESYIRLIG